MKPYNKLIRDIIPEKLQKSGRNFTVETLNHDRYIMELNKKLNEELVEYQEAPNKTEALEELADIIEVIHCLAKVHGGTVEELEKIRAEKSAENGSYEEKLYLVEIEDEK